MLKKCFFPLTRSTALLRREHGMNRLGVLFLILFVSAVVFVGSQVFPFYYYFFEVQGMMHAQAAKANQFSDQEIRKNLLEAIRKLEIPLDSPDDLKINRVSGKIIIELDYQEVLYVDFGEDKEYDLYVFEFRPRAEAYY